MKSKRILIADRDTAVRLKLSQILNDLGHQVRTTSSAETVLNWLSQEDADLVIAEAVGEGRLAIVEEIHKARPQVPIILTSDQTTLAMAVKSVGAGAAELLPKPVQSHRLLAAIDRAFACAHDAEAAKAQARAIRDERLPIVGSAESMQRVYRTFAGLVKPNLPVLIWGESGVGKTVSARALHDFGPRPEAPFIRLPLGAASDETLTHELLGDERSPGKLAQAAGGALFLDGIDDLSLSAQGRLLQLLEGAGAQPSGCLASGGVRLIASSQQDLRLAIAAGDFRPDLYFRLAAAAVRLPPLRERLEDVPALTRALLLRASRDGLPNKMIDAAALRRLQQHDWPGNVRELDNLVRRLCALHTGGLITAQAVELEMSTASDEAEEAPDTSLSELVQKRLSSYLANQPLSDVPPGLYDAVIHMVERPLLQVVLSATRGNQLQAAEILGINRNTLRRKTQDLGLDKWGGGRSDTSVVANDMANETRAAAFSF